MNIDLQIDPVVMRKVEKAALLAGKKVADFLADFFQSKGRPTKREARASLNA